MRKTRLVILPTKCLHQMGFLLLFLSCPVIGDWGRIRPDNENLQKAIDVEREGTCGLQRDTPGGFLHFTAEKGHNLRRFREDTDLKIRRMPRLDERRNLQRLTQNRVDERRNERSTEFRRERDFQERSIRSNSAEQRRNDRNDMRSRSLSLSRLEASRRQTRREGSAERRDNRIRLSLARRMNERENERRVEREVERMSLLQNERSRSTQERENERSVQRLSLQRREEMNREDMNVREKRRLSLSRTEENSRRIQSRSENRRTENSVNLERRLPEIRNSRNDFGNDEEKTVRKEREASSRREVDRRMGQNIRDERRMDVLNRRVERLEKTRRISAGVTNPDFYAEDKTESFFTGVMKWLSIEKYESPKIGDWSSNCVIGAVAYYLSTRQTKAV